MTWASSSRLSRRAVLLRGPLLVLAVVLALGVPGCASTNKRLEAFRALSDEGKELYSKYRQFLSEPQQDELLALPSDDERRSYVAALKIDERIARYPQHVQDAIWAQELVAGMDRGAVLLSWGTPALREVEEASLEQGNEQERWLYHRAEEDVQVVLINGVVTELARSKAQR
jgi:hypothetical protein